MSSRVLCVLMEFLHIEYACTHSSPVEKHPLDPRCTVKTNRHTLILSTYRPSSCFCPTCTPAPLNLPQSSGGWGVDAFECATLISAQFHPALYLEEKLFCTSDSRPSAKNCYPLQAGEKLNLFWFS